MSCENLVAQRIFENVKLTRSEKIYNKIKLT